jgi:hypothetical protein
VTYSQARVTPSARSARKAEKTAKEDDSESQSDEPFQPSASVLARMNRAVVATPSHTAHVPLGGVSSLQHGRSVTFTSAPSAAAIDASAVAAAAAAAAALGTSAGVLPNGTPAAAALDTRTCVECKMRKANSLCSNSCCRSCCFAMMNRTGITCAEHTKARATLERERQLQDAPEQLLSGAVASSMTNVASVVARMGGPRIDPLAPYSTAVSDALTAGQPVIDTAALSAAARTSILSPATGQHIAVHGGNFWSHLYASDRSNLGAYLQLAVDRARAWNVAPDNALALPPPQDALSSALPVDQVRARAAQRLADNEALLGSLFGLAATANTTMGAPTAQSDAATQWKRIEAQIEALDGSSLDAVVNEAESAAQVYAEAIQRIDECSSVADVNRCREKMKREWLPAFDDGGIKRRRTATKAPATTSKPQKVLNL